MVGATLGVMSSDHLSLFGIIQQLFLPTQSFPLIAIPFFVMAAELMMTGKLGQHLIDLPRIWWVGFVAGMRKSASWVHAVRGSVWFSSCRRNCVRWAARPVAD